MVTSGFTIVAGPSRCSRAASRSDACPSVEPRRGRALPAGAPRAVRRPASIDIVQVLTRRPRGAQTRRGESRRDPLAGRDPAGGGPAAARRRPPALRRSASSASSAATSTSCVLVVAAVALLRRLASSGLRDRLRGRLPARPRERRDDGGVLARAHRRSATASGASASCAIRATACCRWRSAPRPRPVFVVAFAAVSFMLDVGCQREPAGDPRHDRDHPAQRAARAAGLHRCAASCCGRSLEVDPLERRRRRRPPRETGPLGLRGLEV